MKQNVTECGMGVQGDVAGLNLQYHFAQLGVRTDLLGIFRAS